VKRYTEDIEAYQLYLKGRYYWNKRTEGDLYKSIEYFERAIKSEPKYAPAHSGLADAYIVLGKFGAMPTREAMPKAKSAAARALEIDETLADAHVSLGSIMAVYEWDWPAAEIRYKQALELNSGYATAHHWYAYDYLAPLGRLDKAIE